MHYTCTASPAHGTRARRKADDERHIIRQASATDQRPQPTTRTQISVAIFAAPIYGPRRQLLYCYATPVLELSQQIIALYWRKFTPMTLIENFLRSKIVGREGGIYSQSEIKQPKYNRNKNSPTEDQRHCFLLQYCFSFIMPPPP